jgi:hypothetical protein
LLWKIPSGWLEDQIEMENPIDSKILLRTMDYIILKLEMTIEVSE